MTKIRTRIAPSPTGDPHVGTAYIALFNYCFAKQHNGEFILRIEDTDQVRSTKESEQKIFDALRWLGLEWSEGPDVGGPHAPYRQSERSHIYKKYATQLVEQGHAFYCFCTSEELDSMRQDQLDNNLPQKYDGRGLLLSKKEIEDNLNANIPYVIRMKVPEDGDCVFNDLLRGEISIPWKQIDMQVLLKADGLPTYFLANVVDDHLMEISHVIRGEEWLSSTPKIKLLYQYFGWDMPIMCHMPLLRNIDKSKLSKRKNPTAITFYRDNGYLPETVLNYLGRMGWSMPDEKEKFKLQEMIDNFDISRISLGGPIFDIEKMSWLNGLWLRDLTDDEFKSKFITWATANDRFDKLIPMIKSRVENFGGVVNLAGFMFKDNLDIDIALFEHKKMSVLDVKQTLQLILWNLESLRVWSNEKILETVKLTIAETGFKVKDVMPLLFVSITGSLQSISVIDAMQILGPDITRYRLRKAIELLGGLTDEEIEKINK